MLNTNNTFSGGIGSQLPTTVTVARLRIGMPDTVLYCSRDRDLYFYNHIIFIRCQNFMERDMRFALFNLVPDWFQQMAFGYWALSLYFCACSVKKAMCQ